MRPAGAAVLATLGDNAITRGWADFIARRVVSPLERLTMSDDDLRMGLAKGGVGHISDQGEITQEFQDRVRMAAAAAGHKPELVDELVARPAALEYPSADKAREEMGNYLLQILGNVDRAKMVGMERKFMGDPTAMYSDTSGGVNLLLGNPVAAYGAVGAGGTLGAVALMDIAQRIAAAQQEGEREASKKKPPAPEEAGG